MSYQKQTFINNKTALKAEHLNHMEEGIATAVDGVESILRSHVNYDLNVKAVNHRGFSAEAPENTLPAYAMSKRKGFTYVECDVAFTLDNVAVLLHDDTIDRTSNGSGKISSMTYEAASKYDFGSWFSSEYTGTKIPTFT